MLIIGYCQKVSDTGSHDINKDVVLSMNESLAYVSYYCLGCGFRCRILGY